MRKIILLTALVLAVGAGACSDDGDRDTEAAAGAPAGPADGGTINPADFSPTITNPLVPLSSVRNTEFVGREQKDGKTSEIRVASRLLDKTDTIAGVTVAVVEVTEHKDGQLLELTEDYFAQHRDGTVWYFGERVTDYKDGKPVGHGGQWLAGDGGNRPGVFMPASPTVGQEFAPEQVPGVADERSKILELGVEVTVPAGKFTDCVKVEDHDLLDNERGYKFYCPQVGLVREEGSSSSSDLVRFA